MQVSEMSYFVGRKVNDGNYGSLDFMAGEKITLGKDDDPEVEYDRMRNRVLKRLMRDLSERGIEG